MARTVEAAFIDLLGRQNLTRNQVEEANNRINNLATFLKGNFALASPPFLTGSYARDTLCSSERDIDMLVPFSASDYWERYKGNSRNFLYWFRDYVNDRYATTRVGARQVAVRLFFVTFAVEVAPGFHRKGEGYLIPNGRGGWLHTNPPFHARLVDDDDAKLNRNLKPLVRLMKAWNFANGHKLSSFHVEMMVRRMWNDTDGTKRSINSWPIAVASTLKAMPGWVAGPFPDPWSPGGNVDDYLASQTRQEVVRTLREDAERAADAEQHRQGGRIEQAFDRWRIIYNNTFPAYG